MSQVVGTAFVRLRLLTDTIGKDIKQSIEKSDLQDVHIKVDVDALEADAQLEATKKLADEVDKQHPTIKVDTKESKKNINALWTAVALLGPTIGPLGAVAVGAFGALAAEAGVGLLALQGVKKEMKDGTAVGAAFGSGIQLLKTDLATLESTAAKGVLPGFQLAVTSLNASMPSVNKSVAGLSAILGDIGGHVVVGLVAGLRTFDPLLTHIAAQADVAAGHFQAWATGPGGGQFASALGNQFDKVVPVLVHLTEAVAKLVVAFLPIGDHVVGIIGMLANAINAIPIPVLTALADIFVTLYTANRLVVLFKNLSISIAAFGATSTVASVGVGRLVTSTAAFTAALGPVAAVLVAGYAVTQQFGDQLDKLANQFATGKIGASVNSTAMDELRTVYFDATHDVNAATDSILHFAVSGKLTGQGIGGLSDKVQALVPRFKDLGVTSNDVESGVSGTDAAFQALITTINQHGGATKQDIDTLNELHKTFANTQDAIDSTAAVLQALANSPGWGTLKTSKDSIAQVGAQFDLSADAVKHYASLLGISATAIKNGVVTNQQLADVVTQVAGAYNTADAAGATFLDALEKFSKSAGTAADRAQLIGAYLKAAQGDALGYAGAVSSAYAASQNLVNSFDKQQRAAIDLKTGLIDVTKVGAGPLIQSLQGMQTAAENAAIATYQHEVAEKGAGQAASDAATIFKNQTYTALVDNARQLGLTKDQATALANQYFQMPKDIATRVRALGTNDVVNVLNQIGQQLSYLTGHAWVPTVIANTGAAISSIQRMQNALNALNGKTVSTYVYTNYITVGNKQQAGSAGTNLANRAKGGLIQYRASGGPSGMVTGPGTGTSDTAGLYALSNGEYVINAVATARYLPLIKAINAQGMAGGGMTAAGSPAGLDGVIAEIRILAAMLADRPVQLVATNGGLPLAKVVNDANLVNARRTQ